MRTKLVKESLYEAGRGRPKKEVDEDEPSVSVNDKEWYAPDDEDDEEIEVDDSIDVDISDIENAEEIVFDDDSFDEKLLKALKSELKIPEFSRRVLKFKLKNELDKKSQYGIPMANIRDEAFLFKMKDNSIKKIKLNNILLTEFHSSKTRKFDEFDIGWRDQL